MDVCKDSSEKPNRRQLGDAKQIGLDIAGNRVGYDVAENSLNESVGEVGIKISNTIVQDACLISRTNSLSFPA